MITLPRSLVLVPVGIAAALVLAHHQATTYIPDETVYAKTALRLSVDRAVTLAPGDDVAPLNAWYKRVGEGRYVSKYPPGLPLVLAAAHRVGGVGALFWVGLGFMGLGLVLIQEVGRRLVDDLTGWVAAWLLGTNVVYLRFANSVMSDLPAAVWGLAGLACVVVGRGGWSSLASGILLGAAVATRYVAVLALVPVVAAVLLRTESSTRDLSRGRSLAIVLVGLASVLAGLLAYRVMVFGNVTGTPSEEVVTGRGDRTVEWSYVGQSLNSLRLGKIPRNLASMGGALALPRGGGLGLVALVGLALLRERRLAALLLFWVLPTLGLHAVYDAAGPDLLYLRFFLPIYPAVALLAAVAVASPARARPRRGGLAATLVAALIIGGLAAAWSRQTLAEETATVPDSEELSTLADRVPAGSCIIGRRPALNVIAVTHHGRHELLVENQRSRRPDEEPHLIKQGAMAWRLNLYEMNGEELVEENLKRVDGRLQADQRVFLLVRLRALQGYRRAFEGRYEVSLVDRTRQDAGEAGYVLAEVRPVQSGQSSPPADSS